MLIKRFFSDTFSVTLCLYIVLIVIELFYYQYKERLFPTMHGFINN